MTKQIRTPHSEFAAALRVASDAHAARVTAALDVWKKGIIENALLRPAERATAYRGADMALRTAHDNSVRLLTEDRQASAAAFSVAVGTPGVMAPVIENPAQLIDQFLALPDHDCGNFTKFKALFERKPLDLVFDHPDDTEGMAAQVSNGMKNLIEAVKGVKFQHGTPTNIAQAEKALIQNITSALRLIARSPNVAGETRATCGDLVEKLRLHR